VGHFLSPVFEVGFFGSPAVHTALVVGGVVALVAGPVGVFTVMRGQSFAGHALADVSTTGGSGAFLLGVNPFWGFVVMGLAATSAMEMIGVQRPRSRDVATGIVLGGVLGLAALFLYLGTTTSTTTGASITILFGSMFVIDRGTAITAACAGVVVLVMVVTFYRTWLLSSLSADMAASRGVPVRLVGVCCLAAMALAVALSAITIGAVLSTALLIGPAATALRLTARPGLATISASLIGLGATWIGILLAYDSFDWPPAGRGWPVSFFVVVLIFAAYLLAGLRHGGGREPVAGRDCEPDALGA
jgi:zinc/manganese transport system permease protein